MRRYLVWPAAMIWPSTLPTCAFLRSLHESREEDLANNISKWKISRLRLFLYIFIFSFTWYWFPGYIFPIISSLSFICAMNPTNVVFSQITGVNGLGVGTVQLDWNSITAYLGSPIVVPLWAQLNILASFVLFCWIIIPAIYYTNTWGGKSFPIGSSNLYTSEGYLYNISCIADKNSRLNITAYNIYGAGRMSIMLAVAYGVTFMALPSCVTHVFLFFGRDILRTFNTSITSTMNDVHTKLMAKYKDVPEWWYTILFSVNFVVACLVCHFGGLMTWYWMFLSVIIAFIFMLPTGIIQALSNQQIELNLVSQHIAGYLMNGDAKGNMTFKVYTYQIQAQALLLISNLKLGHYMKIPPRSMFTAQVIATIITCIVSLGFNNYLLRSIKNICASNSVQWNCSQLQIYYTASVLWGLIGTTRQFLHNSVPYYNLFWFFPIGVFLPVIQWFFVKKFKAEWLRYVNVPIMCIVISNLLPAPAGNFPSWLFLGFVFNLFIKRYASVWWGRYAYVTSSAMDCGLAFSALIIVVLQNNGMSFPNWWGITGYYDGHLCPLSYANYSGVIPSYKTT
ncbi:unnamed protein product [Didymodactylos carnosus]|uniref:OPT superfamily oligopeptide transporter n=1 Tax=Didymodactylos carnosus TaxID=1234261 RepID=A0A8S2K597_9BILA|nr:unnamed protein product [Didymodactylos carnosus]CAF3837792.1 unnamed protein product [Didymodactylos carnosus]